MSHPFIGGVLAGMGGYPHLGLLSAVALLAGVVAVAATLHLLLLSRPEHPGRWRAWARRVLILGAVGWAAGHAEAVRVGFGVLDTLDRLGPRVTLKDRAMGAVLVVDDSWWGTAVLGAALLGAAALVLAGRGRRRPGAAAFSVVLGVLLLSVLAGDTERTMARWEVHLAVPPRPLASSGTWVPEEAMISQPPPLPSPFWLYAQPALSLLLWPAGAVVLVGIAEAGRAAAGRRPRWVPFTDPHLLLGLGAVLCLSVLRVESALVERAMVVVRWGPKAPPTGLLVDDLLRTAAPAAAVAWVGLAVLSVGLLDRVRGKDGRDGAA